MPPLPSSQFNNYDWLPGGSGAGDRWLELPQSLGDNLGAKGGSAPLNRGVDGAPEGRRRGVGLWSCAVCLVGGMVLLAVLKQASLALELQAQAIDHQAKSALNLEHHWRHPGPIDF